MRDKFERITGTRCHTLLRRGVFFCHRDFDLILDYYEKK
jgi:tryptophanyl-tRNA synthetase